MDSQHPPSGLTPSAAQGPRKKEKISINEFISTVVAEKMSALLTEDYLETLARQGDRETSDRVLAKVPSVPPAPWDRWDEAIPSEDEPAEAEFSNGSRTRRS